MTSQPLRQTFTITNPQGLHMRPLTAFVKAASQFQSEIYLVKEGGPRINGKSMIHLLSLAAEQGTQLTLEVEGPDASQALENLMNILSQNYDED